MTTYIRAWLDRHPGYNQARLHGMTVAQVEEVLNRTSGRCAICGSTDRLGLDHDHACCPTKSTCCGHCVRGFLCVNCNLGLGSFCDDATLLEAAAKYLREAR